MNTFDAPSRESCTVRRARTNTPMQALLLFNDPQYVETARGLALRTMLQGGSTDAERAAYLFRVCTGRHPTDEELSELLEGFGTDAAYFAGLPDATTALLKFVGDMPADGVPLNQLAAWTMAANTLLCLDEVITKN